MKQVTVMLPERVYEKIEKKIEEGEYATLAEFVRYAIMHYMSRKRSVDEID